MTKNEETVVAKGCSVEGCDRPHDSRGLCAAHVQRLRNTGDVRAKVPIGGYILAGPDDVLAVIKRAVHERGYPPSVREIGEELGLDSPSSVHAHLNTLVAEGRIRREPGKPRAITIVEES